MWNRIGYNNPSGFPRAEEVLAIKSADITNEPCIDYDVEKAGHTNRRIYIFIYTGITHDPTIIHN